MRGAPFLVALVFSLRIVAAHAAPVVPDAEIKCSSCPDWNRPHEPFKIFGNTYYVGPAELSSVLIATNAGLILLDGALPQSAQVIEANLHTLGFRVEDIKLIVNSHTHYDHAGGIAALQRASGAQVAASPSSARALAKGEPVPDDPQHGYFIEANRLGAVKVSRILRDGETLTVGDVTITAHATPGHTPGSTTWTWRSCEGSECLSIVYSESLNAVAAPGFRFSGDKSHPSREKSFRKSIAKVRALPCDIMISVHPDIAGIEEKFTRLKQGATPNPFIDREACKTYADDAEKLLDKRLHDEAVARAGS